MAYSDKVIDHYENPRNVGSLDPKSDDVGTGLVGAPACGDVMRLQIRVNEEGVIEDARFKTFGCGSAIASSSLATEWIKGKKVEEARFKTFGCGSAIASSSLATEWIKGKKVDEAGALSNSQIATELNLPPVKIHCSVLAEDAIKSAIEDYKKKQEARRALAAAGKSS
jgi:nitrogen fixation NifU-like protein